jgi:hypothetical protein
MTKDKDAKDGLDHVNPRLLDTRTIDRNIKRGLVSRKDYDKHVKALPDVKDKILPPKD